MRARGGGVVAKPVEQETGEERRQRVDDGPIRVGLGPLDANAVVLADEGERRDLPTKLTVTNPGGTELVFTGSYNPDGTLVTEQMPGGITRSTTVDEAGEVTQLTYTGQVTSVGADETNTVDPNGVWFGWSADHDILGRVVHEWTPEGAGFTEGGLEAGAAAGYSRRYSYDQAGRLTDVEDHTAQPGAGYDPETGELLETTCETRSYTFDANGNRTSLTRTGANPDGTCATSGGTTTTWSYDAADRLTTGGNGAGAYGYDTLGRVTTLPGADTPAGAPAGELSIAYYLDDSAASITQNGTTTSFTLDAAGRRSTETTTGVGTTETLERHYTDTGDNPAWVTQTVDGVSSKVRYATSLGGDLAATITTPDGGTPTGALPVVDLHGDAVTTIDIPTTGAAAGIGAWVDHDEYGNPLDTAAAAVAGTVTNGVGYGWLGGKQRATLANGLILMGARLYNRATGQFTSPDPIFAGGDTAYAYPTDPINTFDLDGRHWYSSAWKYTKKVGCALITSCWMSRSGTYTASADVYGSAGYSYSRYGGRSRVYGNVGLQGGFGGAVSWSPGMPNPKKKFSGSAGLCYYLCVGVSSGYKGRFTYRGYTLSVGFGTGRYATYYGGSSRLL